MSIDHIEDMTVAELRLQLADLERQLNRVTTEVERTVKAWENGDDLSRRMHVLANLKALRPRWTVESVLEKIREWQDRYGEPPTAMEWNPALARARDREDVISNFTSGDWPHASTVQKHCGSWNRAIEAAGFEPLTAANGHERRMHEYRNHADAWPEWTGWELVRFFRERAEMTQAQAASAASLSVAWVQQVETGENTNPQIRALLSFARGVGVRVDALIGGSEGGQDG